MFARLRSTLNALFKRHRLEDRMDQEMRFHLESLTDEMVRSGLPREEAERQARLAFGGVEVAQEQCREAKGLREFDQLRQDIRYAARILRKNPGFAIVSALTLSLGIGVNTAILSAVYGLVLRPLPVEKPSELIVPHWGRKTDAQVWGGFSWANYVDMRAQNSSFADLCAWDQVSASLSFGESRHAGDDARAELVWGELVSGNYFDVMGVKPMLGRGFLPEEDRTPNAHPVVVLSHSLWQRRFKADPGVMGQTHLRPGVAAGLRQRGESDAGTGRHARQGNRDSAGDRREPGTHRAATPDGKRVACRLGRRAGVGFCVLGGGRNPGDRAAGSIPGQVRLCAGWVCAAMDVGDLLANRPDLWSGSGPAGIAD